MIYLVEDDNNIRELVIYTLNQAGMEAQGFGLPSEFWSAMAHCQPDLVLLDLMLPEEDGLSILKKLRNSGTFAQLPVLILSAKGSEYEKVVGLDQGADDYLAKPFGMMELVARVRALMRRAVPRKTEESLSFESICIWPKRRLVQVQGEEITLTRKEFDLLCLLMESGEQVVSRETLISKVWGYDFQGESRTVDVHVRTLRQKLGAAGDCIETVRGVGFRLRGHSV